MPIHQPHDAIPHSKVRLTIECSGLQNKDTFSKSDPTCIVQMKAKDGRWFEIGRTEKINNDLNPKFKTKIETDYLFEEVQDMQFLVYDIDSGSAKLDDHDFLGSLTTSMGAIVGSRGSCLIKPLSKTKGADEKRYGSIKVMAEEVSSGKGDFLKIRFAGSKLASKDWMGKGDKYLMIKRQRGDGQFEEVCKTEVVKNNKDPTWNPMEIPLSRLNLGKMDAPLLIEVWDWNSVSAHDFMGQVLCTGNDLLQPRSFKVEKPKSKNPGKDRGEVIVQFCELVHPPSFLEYISGGCEITVMVAIDFTASNKPVKDPNSLHFMNPNGWNQYQQAIMSVGEILDKYNQSQEFEAYGFGGKLPNGQVSHCFALNGSSSNQTVHGVQGILDAYSSSIQNVELYGPTNFASIIHAANAAASRISGSIKQEYIVLLIITDGEITDLDQTIDAIVKASGMPLSIVIVGVGGADFAAMQQLDGDDEPLKSQTTGQRVQRDIVQFVAFRDLKNDGARLAKEVLAEIPEQLTSYMRSHNLKPMPRPQVSSQWAPPHAAGGGGIHHGVANLNINAQPPPAAAPWQPRSDPGA
uniref:C2 domain-containing protein n=1 Tax=Hemiselmis tepida TaxID=464990 RepID=A0A7S0VQP8_9CRYP|mmetsp:Transcript_19224/g.48616  ORF Transcript_19224/g.48616 Transcript_19224/m.48616 type:complete len:577 (+) Transcript_19224:44-1774(+)